MHKLAPLYLLSFLCQHALAQYCEPVVFNKGHFLVYRGYSFAPSQDLLYLAQQTEVRDSSGAFISRIYHCRLRKGKWQPLVEANLDTPTGASDSGPHLQPDGTLWFQSNRKLDGSPGFADFNIWVAKPTGGGYGKPMPATALNSSSFDGFPSLDAKGHVYFRSDRAGNADIYCYSNQNVQRLRAPNTALPEGAVHVATDARFLLITRGLNRHQLGLFISFATDTGWTACQQVSIPGQRIYGEQLASISANGQSLYFTSAQNLYEVHWPSVLTAQQRQHLGLGSVKTCTPIPKSSHPFDGLDEKSALPVAFAAGRFQTLNGISFGRRGHRLFISQYDYTALDSAGNPAIRVYYSDFLRGTWGALCVAPFSQYPQAADYHPVVSPSGNRMVFNSRRPLPGTASKAARNDLWEVTLSDTGFGKPMHLAALATAAYDDYGSYTQQGSLYFRSDRNAATQGDIYISKRAGQDYLPPVPVRELNSSDNENDVCIDPKERFVIFNRYYDNSRELDLFVSIRTASGWSQPRPLAFLNHKAFYELTPTLSPDGRFFLFEKAAMIYAMPTRSLFTEREWRLINENKD